MAVPVDPSEDGGGGDGGGGTGGGGTPSGTPTPPTQPGTKIALQVSSTNITITSDQITAAGGPWSSFKVRVTPLNANGAGVYQEASVTIPAPTPTPTSTPTST